MQKKLKYPEQVLFWLYLILFISIIFCLRAVTSISIGLILVIAVAGNKKRKRLILKKDFATLFFTACLLLFIAECISLIYTNHFNEGVKLLSRNSGLVVIPLAVLYGRPFITIETFRKLMTWFTVILSLASLYCLAWALINFFSGQSASVFFYHTLVQPLSQHAIQFSILVFIALVFLVESQNETGSLSNKSLFQFLIVFLSCFLLLLASKLIISFYILYLLHFFFLEKIHKATSALFVFLFACITIIALAVPNPVAYRFRELFTGSFQLFEQPKFNKGVYFNGLQFRLLEWRFTFEILNEQKAWMQGLTPGDAQSFLDQKYVQADMYTGSGKDHGFLGYHTHNQFLQVLLKNGIIGLAVFLLMVYSLIGMTLENRNRMQISFIVLLLLYCFTDAPLETQYGLILFLFFPMFLQLSGKITPIHRYNQRSLSL